MLDDLTITFTASDLAGLSPEQREFVLRQHLLRAPVSQPDRTPAGGGRDPWKVVESQDPEAIAERLMEQQRGGHVIEMAGPAGPRW